MSKALKKQIERINDDDYKFARPETKIWKHLIKLNQVYGHSFYTENNNVELITDGVELQNKLLNDIKNAKKTVDVEYYIIKNDFVGMKLINLLTEKAKEGVEVRLLMDTLGSRSINDVVLSEYLKAGGKVGYFFKPKLKIIAPKFNYRNHRKIVIVDHEIGYTGGYNVAREYIGRKKRFGYWRDTHVRIKGNAVVDLYGRFALDWRFTTKEQLDVIPKDFAFDKEKGSMGIQIVSCGPESDDVNDHIRGEKGMASNTVLRTGSEHL